MWIACWYDKLAKKIKYVWLADSADLRQARDQEKYTKAQKLESNVAKVRAEIAKRMEYENKSARASIDKERRDLHAARQATEMRLMQATEAGDTATRQKLEDALAKIQADEKKLQAKEQRVHAEEMKTREWNTSASPMKKSSLIFLARIVCIGKNPCPSKMMK
jgi:hypothetical protein